MAGVLLLAAAREVADEHKASLTATLIRRRLTVSSGAEGIGADTIACFTGDARRRMEVDARTVIQRPEGVVGLWGNEREDRPSQSLLAHQFA